MHQKIGDSLISLSINKGLSLRQIIMQKLSVLHYVQSICPVPAPLPNDVPAVMKLLLSPAAATSTPVALLGLAGLTALVLTAACRAARRLEINYGTE